MNAGNDLKQKVLHNAITTMAAHTTGSYSKNLSGVSELAQHSICLPIVGSPTGVVTIRARPVGGGGFAKIGIESVDIAAEDLLSWVITGFFDAWVLIVETGVASGSCQLTVSSCTEGL